ncbi:MAG: hypothetical protein M5U30_15685 [Burkholderiaceae bacterium]|nr:hypothetical protein [Burkholderiaceae bacterium]
MRFAAHATGAWVSRRAAKARSLAMSGLWALVAPAALAQPQSQPPSPAPTVAASPGGVDAQALHPAPLSQLLATARSLIDGGRADVAFRTLEARVADYAGDPDFDYLLGLAALDSGRPGQAVIALERVLMVRPGFLQARAEIARAYFALRERENARREFETVAAQRIPEDARRIIGRYRTRSAASTRPGGPAWSDCSNSRPATTRTSTSGAPRVSGCLPTAPQSFRWASAFREAVPFSPARWA